MCSPGRASQLRRPSRIRARRCLRIASAPTKVVFPSLKPSSLMLSISRAVDAKLVLRLGFCDHTSRVSLIIALPCRWPFSLFARAPNARPLCKASSRRSPLRMSGSISWQRSTGGCRCLHMPLLDSGCQSNVHGSFESPRRTITGTISRSRALKCGVSTIRWRSILDNRPFTIKSDNSRLSMELVAIYALRLPKGGKGLARPCGESMTMNDHRVFVRDFRSVRPSRICQTCGSIAREGRHQGRCRFHNHCRLSRTPLRR